MKQCIIILFIVMLFHLSCQKQFLCPDCDTNQPPVANAGPDQKIDLPKDSILLDGTASTDANGGIISYKWRKITGPSAYNINDPETAKTIVKTLVMGVYQFELTVKNNAGLSAKDTVQVMVGNPRVDQPPVSCAGADQSIILPVNTITLDGSCSVFWGNDSPAYSWVKISGPLSFTISNPNAMSTQVTELVEGIYHFELQVTEQGLISRDTVQVRVNAGAVSGACDNSSRPQVTARLVPFATISKSKFGAAVASAGNKIVFAGGQSSRTPNCTRCEDLGSSRVDIYDIVTNTWSVAELSKPRYSIGAVAAGNKIFFAGGESGDGRLNEVYSTVDIYDVSTNTWSVASLSEPRSYVAAGVIGNKVFFAGGEINDRETSRKIDIYDLSAKTWTTAQLSEARASVSAVTVNNKIYFAGGWVTNFGGSYTPSKKIDIYDNVTNSWTTSSLNGLYGPVGSVTVADKIYWAAGCNVEIRNVTTGNSVTDFLFRSAYWVHDDGQNAVVKNNKIIFFRSDWVDNNKFDIYDIVTGSWSIGVLPEKIQYSSIISVNNTIYILGGFANYTGNINPSDQVWKLEF